MADDVLDIPVHPRLLADGDGPLYRRVAAALESTIERANVTPGLLLPTERALAERLGVSRSTVVAAYDHLRAGGLVERRQGSGTRIAASAVARASAARESQLVEALDRNVLFRGVIQGTDGAIDFLGAYLPAVPQFGPAVIQAAGVELASALTHHGYFPHGYPPLQEAVAGYLTTWGVPTVPREVLITSGAQQAVSLAMGFFLQRGEPVALENPSYAGVLDAAASVGAFLVPVPVGMDGARLGVLEAILEGRQAKLVYLNPSFHNPTGTVMPDTARAEVARLVTRHQVVLIDDGAEMELSFGDEAPPPIAAHAPDAPILTVGTMSKLFWGGLRVGWIRGPAALVDRLTAYKAMLDLGTSLPGQVIATHLLRQIDAVRRERRAMLRSNYRLLSTLLQERLPSWSWTPPKGGLSVWARLPTGSARQLATEALRHGVAILAGPVVSPNLSFDNHIRLTLARSPEVLTEGMRRLASAWDEFSARAQSRSGALEVIV